MSVNLSLYVSGTMDLSTSAAHVKSIRSGSRAVLKDAHANIPLSRYLGGKIPYTIGLPRTLVRILLQGMTRSK